MSAPRSIECDCSTIIVGKKASSTGWVIVAHNEDDGECSLQSHLVPRLKHQPGETISFPDGTAVVPQPEETCAFYWSELRGDPGVAFGDGFVNEHGVCVVSNGCNGSKLAEDGSSDGGLGYGLRYLIAGRCRTAREGVEAAAALLDEFGYRSARAYTIADKDEAWVLQVAAGHSYAARRVGDDEILYIPNWYTIHQIDFSDTEHKNFYWAKDVVTYARKQGWYTPAREGDFSDFDFAEAYQHPQALNTVNSARSDLAWKLLGFEGTPWRTFSLKAKRKYNHRELRAMLRSHGHDGSAGSPHFFDDHIGLCIGSNSESMIIQFREDPRLTCMWRAIHRPCGSPYVPWYLGITRIPQGYEWMDHAAALATHFLVGPMENRYDPQLAYWDFHALQKTRELKYLHGQDWIRSGLLDLERYWDAAQPAVESGYRILLDRDPGAAAEYLTDYTAAQAQKAWTWARKAVQYLGDSNDHVNMG